MMKRFKNVSSKLRILCHFEQKDPTNSCTYNMSMLSAKVMSYLLRLAPPLLNSSIVQKLEFFKVNMDFDANLK